MDIKELAKYLPEEPRKGMLKWAVEKFEKTELGGNFLLFKRVPIELETVPVCMTMTTADWDRYDKGIKRHWAAECKCTACSEKFITGWNKRKGWKLKGIKIHQGEDGLLYDGFIDENYTDYDIAEYTEGDGLICPYCEENVRLLHYNSIRCGRTYQLMIISIEVIKGYAVVMTWGVRRHIDYNGDCTVSVYPFEALAIDGRKFQCFTHVQFNEWAESHRNKWKPRQYIGQDLTMRRYYDYNSWYHRKTGAALWENVPDLSKSTAEKTGLQEYIKGCETDINVFGYLKYWKKHPQIENLIYSQWRNIVDSEIAEWTHQNNRFGAVYAVGESNVIDFTESKPHKMLGITKAESKLCYQWTNAELYYYQIQQIYKEMSVSDFDDYLCIFGTNNVEVIIEMCEQYERCELTKVAAYIGKQLDRNIEDDLYEDDIDKYIGTFYDYLEMLHGNAEPGRKFTDEEYFPTDIVKAHDRLVEIQQIKADEKLRAAFRKITKKYNQLSYSDGELCIFVCPSEKELIKEGDTLRHCVGGYGKQHCSESDVIFFVRHSRRPERSYYTLDIRMNKGKPSRVQLHGYGNERHGEHKQYSHRIPQKVLDFCEKWEKEILLPMWETGRLNDKEHKENGKSDSTAA